MTGAELLRALDQTAQEHDWEPEVYLEDLKPRISKYLRGRPSDGINPIALPEWALDRVSELNATRVRVLQEHVRTGHRRPRHADDPSHADLARRW